MQTLNFEIAIHASPAVIWNVLIGPETYRQWTKAFSPNSCVEGAWQQGNEISFLDPALGGTRAVLDTVEPEKRIVARHIALVSKEGQVSTTGEMADKWLGTIEDYQILTRDNVSYLQIEIRTHEDFAEMFTNAWPQALAFIRELSEGDAGLTR